MSQSRILAGWGIAATAMWMLPTHDVRADDPPNIVIVIGDDCTFSDLSLYGGTNVETPHLERLAKQGMRFEYAFVSMSMCLPCRSAMYTGQYPHRNGASWNHSACRPGTKSICHYLGELGYRVGLTGKKHVVPAESFPFINVPGFEPGCVKQTADHEVTGIRKFMSAQPGTPFCLIVGLVSPHVPWTVGDPDHFDPKKLELPPYLADTPQTRTDYARYLAEIEVMDQQVGDVLTTLELVDHADDTLVIVTSEQGAQFPGCKWTNWDQGVRTGFLVRWPGKVAPFSVTEAMIQYEDVLPTLIEAAGGEADSEDFDGASFLPVLLGEKSTHREYAYAMHNNIPEGPPYPIRSVRTTDFRYIRNLSPEEIYIERHVMGIDAHNPYWAKWMFSSPFNTQSYNMLKRYMRRPAEELYLTRDDKYELTNLAENPAYADVKAQLSAELDRWMSDQSDPGAALDSVDVWNRRRVEAGLNDRQN